MFGLGLKSVGQAALPNFRRRTSRASPRQSARDCSIAARWTRIGNAALPEIEAYANGALALVDARLHEALGESLVALQAFGRELGDGLLRNARGRSPYPPVS